GMLSVGVIGVAFLGNIQDKEIDRELLTQNPAIHAEVVGGEQVSVFGTYRPLDHDKIAALDAGDQSLIGAITDTAKKNALATVAIFPAIMLVCYLALIYYFKSKGGYKAEVLTTEGEM
ncbi:MAG: MFS transporter, partial [Candidatus Marinimicrobia bacterium]|nr:MFS transporter [Candidatus Neomarinimicrobiota bacterium]